MLNFGAGVDGRRQNSHRTLGNNHRRKDDDYSHDSRDYYRIDRKTRVGRNGRWSSSGRNTRSHSPRSDCATSDAEFVPVNTNFKVSNINKRLFTPVKDGIKNVGITIHDAMPRLLTPRSFQRKAEKDIAKRVRK